MAGQTLQYYKIKTLISLSQFAAVALNLFAMLYGGSGF
jgi:hypothetical protein